MTFTDAVLVAFTLPALSCDGTALHDLDSLWVRYRPTGSAVRVAQAVSVRGQEGAAWSTWVAAPPDTVTSVWVDTKDISGNLSCAGNVLWLQPTTSVPVGTVGRVPWYDVQGRAVADTTQPGVYWNRKRRIKVVR